MKMYGRGRGLVLAVCFAAALHDAVLGGRQARSTEGAYVATMTFDVASIHETKPDVLNGFRVGGQFEPASSSHLTLENNGLLNLIC